MQNEDLNNLLTQGTQLYSEITVDSKKQIFLKNTLFKHISGEKKFVLYEYLTNKCKDIFDKISPNRIWVARMKEMVFDNLKEKKLWYVFKFPIFNKKVWSYIILFTFTIGLFGSLTLTTAPDVYAKDTILYINQGNVEIRRNGQAIKGENEFVLQEGDTIKTFKSAQAWIKYPDQNSSNIQENSLIYFQKLFFDARDITKSDVKIYLNEGRLLNTVFNSLLSESEFKITTTNADINAIHAIFDVAIQDKEENNQKHKVENSVEVSVLNSFVDVTLKNGQGTEIQSKTVFKEEQLKVNNAGQYEVVNLNDVLQDDKWLADRIHDASANISEDPINNFNIDAIDTVKSFLSSDERDELKKEFIKIEDLFEDAEYYRQKGMLGTAEKFLEDIESRMNYIFENYKDLDEINQIAQEMQDLISYYRRYRTRYAPAVSYDKYLDAFNNLELLVTQDELSQNKAKLSQALENALIALGQENLELQTSAITIYVTTIQELVDFGMTIENEDLKNEFFKEVSDKSIQVVKSISALSLNSESEEMKTAFEMQKSIHQIFIKDRFRNDHLYAAYTAIYEILLPVTEEQENDIEDNQMVPPESVKDNSATEEVNAQIDTKKVENN